MSRPPGSQGEPIASKAQLVEDLESGCTPRADWRIGTEHEKFPFRLSDHKRLPYFGKDGIGAILNGLVEKFGWEPIHEGGNVIALTQGGCAITLEPGGQFELSGAPLETLHQTCDEVHTHLAQIKEVNGELGVGMLGAGFDPTSTRADIEFMPKGRYVVMSAHMQKVGTLGLDMMKRTCTVQGNYDFESEADMVQKFRISVALQPVATALFANSPFTEGRPNGFKSYRSHVWTDTDPDRCGMLPFVFEDGFGFERYVDYMLDVPMYFLYRDGDYQDVAGKSFRDFMAGKLEGYEGQNAFMGDWTDHMTTSFPEVRLKKYIEMRGADTGPWRNICALPALWTGILYNSDSQQAAADMIADWTIEEMSALRDGVPKHGLQTPFRGGTVQDLAKRMIEISRHGLKRRAYVDAAGNDESGFLNWLQDVAESGKTSADRLLDLYHGDWNGSVDPIFEFQRY
ncbi:glutamate--cysteine ligase [Nisaea sp.]|uniref:glutamate--cysteine ligase n=1 Tax=Nisaea sp. TaxID=2024842 RepID=UPI0032666ACF